MKTAANYTIRARNPIELKVGGDIDQSFDITLPNNLISVSPVLTFMIAPQVNAELRIDVNGRTQYKTPFGTTATRCMQKSLDPDLLKAGDNKINFVVEKGGVTLQDIIIWFQVNLD